MLSLQRLGRLRHGDFGPLRKSLLDSVPAPSGMHGDILAQFGARSLDALADVRENGYAMVTQRRIPHPAVEAIQASGIASLLE